MTIHLDADYQALVNHNNDLLQRLGDAHRLLLYADGVIFMQSGYALADLYAENCEWAQDMLRASGCMGRRDDREEENELRL
jgi:hypothetical protein